MTVASAACVLIASACSAPVAAPPSPPPALDLTAIAAFWPLYETLRAGEPATPAQWEALLATPAYRYLDSVEHKEPLFREAFPAVFAPHGEEAVRELLARRPVYAPFVEHYRRVVEHERALRALQRDLASERLLAKARELANRYLPEAARGEDWWPSVVFCIHAPDGTSYEDLVIIDLLAALDQGPEGRQRFVAHEMHHAYLRRLWPAPVAPDAGSQRLLHALDQLRLEGSADLIDKDVPMRAGGLFPPSYADAYNAAFERTPETLVELDGILVRYGDEPERAAEHGEAFWQALPFAGHPTGAFLARTLLELEGREALVSALESPFSFLRAHAVAARAHGRPGLSSRALAVVEALEARARRASSGP